MGLKLCLTCSAGGHLVQMMQLKGVYEKFDYFFVTHKAKHLKKDKKIKEKIKAQAQAKK